MNLCMHAGLLSSVTMTCISVAVYILDFYDDISMFLLLLTLSNDAHMCKVSLCLIVWKSASDPLPA